LIANDSGELKRIVWMRRIAEGFAEATVRSGLILRGRYQRRLPALPKNRTLARFIVCVIVV
jgi:hypothetical protein